MTKQGGSIKTWKKRWFVLKGDMLYYFKTQKVCYFTISAGSVLNENRHISGGITNRMLNKLVK